YPARAVFGPHRTAAALSHRDRGIAGMGLYRRAAGAAERLSRRGLAALEKEAAQCSGRDVLIWSLALRRLAFDGFFRRPALWQHRYEIDAARDPLFQSG